jgi:cytochrome bd ubiquinol oxidase subunit II
MLVLQLTWFILIGFLLLGYAILDGFDLGVGFWYLFTRDETHRRILHRSIGPVWDGNEVWLLTAGGALFAAFPAVYAAVFSGFYLAMLLVLLGLILRATGLEFRNKVGSPGWRKSWDGAFAVGSALPALLFGVAVGNLVRGLELDSSGNYIGGFFSLLTPYALLSGISAVAMFATHGALFLVLKTEDDLQLRARRWAFRSWLVYLALYVICGGWTLLAFQRQFAGLAALCAFTGLLLLLAVGWFNRSRQSGKAFFASALSMAALFGAIGATLFPNLVPARNRAELSLTIFNSSSSQASLLIMLIVAAIGMPVVISYTIFIYKTFAGPVKAEDNY